MRKHFPHNFMLLLCFCIGSSIVAKGQPDTPHIPKPVIRGDVLLCPNSTSTLNAPEGYDTYQWYKRNFGANRAKAIEGATSNQIVISSNEVPAYFSVLVSAKGIKRKSDEKLVDGLVFLLPSVVIGGDFINGPGYSILKEGDTGIFTLTKPYNTNITWYKNGKPIPGETSTKLYVTTGGIYTVEGAPGTCPNYIVPLGVDLVVKLRPNNNVPVITGDSLLCPDKNGTLITQTGADGYQWYKRPFGQNKKVVIDGATGNTLSVNPIYDAPAYFSVDVTRNGQTVTSEEKLVDSWAFLPPSVMSDGDFTYGPTYFLLNKGDTGTFTLMQPYTTNIQWYRNNEPISGATATTLYVTNRGFYTVEGAPAVCPGYMQHLGLALHVKLNTDSSSFAATNAGSSYLAGTITTNTRLYPNPAKDYTMIDAAAFAGKNITVRLFSTDGRTILYKKYNAFAGSIKIGLGNINPGLYYVAVSDGSTQQMLKLVIAK